MPMYLGGLAAYQAVWCDMWTVERDLDSGSHRRSPRVILLRECPTAPGETMCGHQLLLVVQIFALAGCWVL